MSNAVELQLTKIANGWLVDLQLEPPMTPDWHHEQYYSPTLDEALTKLRDVADACATYGPNIKKALKLEAGDA